VCIQKFFSRAWIRKSFASGFVVLRGSIIIILSHTIETFDFFRRSHSKLSAFYILPLARSTTHL